MFTLASAFKEYLDKDGIKVDASLIETFSLVTPNNCMFVQEEDLVALVVSPRDQFLAKIFYRKFVENYCPSLESMVDSFSSSLPAAAESGAPASDSVTSPQTTSSSAPGTTDGTEAKKLSLSGSVLSHLMPRAMLAPGQVQPSDLPALVRSLHVRHVDVDLSSNNLVDGNDLSCIRQMCNTGLVRVLNLQFNRFRLWEDGDRDCMHDILVKVNDFVLVRGNPFASTEGKDFFIFLTEKHDDSTKKLVWIPRECLNKGEWKKMFEDKQEVAEQILKEHQNYYKDHAVMNPYKPMYGAPNQQ
jgi:hypothetical protein